MARHRFPWMAIQIRFKAASAGRPMLVDEAAHQGHVRPIMGQTPVQNGKQAVRPYPPH